MYNNDGVIAMSVKKYYKYPRTFHFEWSENLQNDDRRLLSINGFLGKDVVVSEKLDGENTSMMGDRIHARSPDSKDHLSRHWVKALHGAIKHQIPKGWRICGENMFALHSIYYKELTSLFYVFSIFDEKNICLSWSDTEDFCKLLGLQTVPVIYKGPWSEEAIKNCYSGKSAFKGLTPKPFIKEFDVFRSKIINFDDLSFFADETQEGYVCRVSDAFDFQDYDKYVAKFVRKSHVKSGNNWMYEIVIPNKLKEK